MTELELLVLLNEIKEAQFLDAFILIKQNEKKYRKSKFYKETKISLSELYKLYYQYVEGRFSLTNKITEIIENLDEDFIVNKLKAIVQKFISSNEIQDVLQKFDLKGVLAESQDLKEMLSKFQNLK